jgi:putative lipoprotein
MTARAMRFAMATAGLGCLAGGVLMGQQAPVAPVAPATPVAPPAHNNVRPAMRWKQFDYRCEEGAKVTVYLNGEMAKVRYQERVYLMKQTQSADGNRYSDGKVVWWAKGDGGFLQEDTPDGNGKTMAKDCQLDKPFEAKASAGTVTGTISCRQRMALPRQALIQVQLLDVSAADMPAKVIAKENVTLGKRQAPVPFELKFDAGKIDAKHKYAVSAQVVVAGELRFVSDRPYVVLTAGNPSHVEMILTEVAAGEARKP